MEGNEYMYVYNFKQALFFMQQYGIIPADIGKGNRDIYIKFKRSDKTEQAMKKWIERGRRM